MARLHFLKPGLQTTIQDLGRHGVQDLGIPINGAMDKASAQLANHLVGNSADSQVLEITLLGPKIQFEGQCQIAITGADLSAEINGNTIPLFRTINIEHGDVLSFGKPLTGCRAYLAINGKWDIQSWLGSFSASATNTAQTTPDSIIVKDQILEIIRGKDQPIITISESERPSLSIEAPIKVYPGPEFEAFSAVEKQSFFGDRFTIGQDSNRMGYRLKEALNGYTKKEEVISSGVIPGTIQITNSGQPIVLMADAQTTGGYPRIANVSSTELDRLAHFKPGDTVRFELISFK
ncbi:5-oxoprolinase subunit C family protein [Roseivirga seohaensis]|uniref:5-oxoprolinase subunit C family protein n=1 Tax=Roseivirga seohaensis TaxID=1914963 RepID=UPI00069D5354|nr:biotin-dependent carboxyltransferase family protein [Roseivirga seohaensis]